jgi:predicted small metal-binding protein
MAKVLQCNGLVPGCKFEARGVCDEEVIAEFADHIATAHNMFEISDEILVMISNAIHVDARVRSRAAHA